MSFVIIGAIFHKWEQYAGKEAMERMDQNQIPFYLLDSASLQKNPKGELQKLCRWLEIDFQESMLSWKAGPLPEDGVWARFWYKSVHESTGFHTPPIKTEKDPTNLLDDPLFQACLPYYQTLKDRYHEQV